MEQTYHILKMKLAYFKNIKYLSTNTPFRTYRKVESEIINTTLSPPEKQSILQSKYGDVSSNFGASLRTIVWIRLDIGHSMTRLGCFQKVLCDLGYLLTR